MAKFRLTIEVFAERVSTLLYMSNSDWQALPAWVRVLYECGKVVFAANAIHTPSGVVFGGSWLVYNPVTEELSGFTDSELCKYVKASK
jgi:hypothetical protein